MTLDELEVQAAMNRLAASLNQLKATMVLTLDKAYTSVKRAERERLAPMHPAQQPPR
jgi:hypothetical protein